jgi:hypothetical protein
MRHFIFVLTLTLSLSNIFAQEAAENAIDSVYCIQLLSTRNIHLVKPEMISAFLDTSYVEQSGEWSRVLVVCESMEQAEKYLTSWRRQHKNAFIVIRSSDQVKKLYPLFTFN